MQIKSNIDKDISDLKSALLRYPTPQIQGAKLNQYIQSVTPGLNIREIVNIPVGAGALKKFISIYLSDHLTHVDYNGGDVIYEIVGHSGDSLQHVDPNIWKTFVSPGSFQNVIVSSDRSKLLQKKIEELLPNEILIPNVSIAEHDKLRDEFIDTLEPEVEDGLKEATRGVREYGEWLGLIRERGFSKRWGEYRRNGLFAVFREKLKGLDLEAGIIEDLCEKLVASQAAAVKSNEQARLSLNPESAVGNFQIETVRAHAAKKVEFGRKLAHSAVDVMSYDELRSIRLSLGVVLDALNER